MATDYRSGYANYRPTEVSRRKAAGYSDVAVATPGGSKRFGDLEKRGSLYQPPQPPKPKPQPEPQDK